MMSVRPGHSKVAVTACICTGTLHTGGGTTGHYGREAPTLVQPTFPTHRQPLLPHPPAHQFKRTGAQVGLGGGRARLQGAWPFQPARDRSA